MREHRDLYRECLITRLLANLLRQDKRIRQIPRYLRRTGD